MPLQLSIRYWDCKTEEEVHILISSLRAAMNGRFPSLHKNEPYQNGDLYSTYCIDTTDGFQVSAVFVRI